ncbi:hypothetical protein UlMin_044922 [Ulmus minor]
MPERNLISWSTVISMYVQHGRNEEALQLFSGFRRSSESLCLGGVDQGAQVHNFVFKTGFDQEVYVGTSLIDFYAKYGDIEEARLVFDALAVKNSVTWTTIITGYPKAGKSEVSLQLYYRMRENDTVPDKYVLSSVLSACAMLEFGDGGKQIHAYVLRMGVEMDVSVVNVLIDFYVKIGKMQEGQRLFDQMGNKNYWKAMKLFSEMGRLSLKPDGYACNSFLTSCGSVEAQGFFDGMTDQSVISYNAMIEGYSRQENLYEALDLFHVMRLRSFEPILVTFVSLPGVSSTLSALTLSKQIHGLVTKCGFSLGIFASSALVVLFQMFERMIKEDIKPNYVTFVGVLSASSHARLIENELFHFEECLFSLFGRAGKLFEAKEVIEKMPIKPEPVVWRSLLSACKVAGNIELAKYAAEMAISNDPLDSGSYILLSNIYASKGMYMGRCQEGKGKKNGLRWFGERNTTKLDRIEQ